MTTDLKPVQDDLSLYLRRTQVTATYALSRSSIYRMMDDEANPFPRPYRLSAKHVVWKRSEVDAYFAKLPKTQKAA